MKKLFIALIAFFLNLSLVYSADMKPEKQAPRQTSNCSTCFSIAKKVVFVSRLAMASMMVYRGYDKMMTAQQHPNYAQYLDNPSCTQPVCCDINSQCQMFSTTDYECQKTLNADYYGYREIILGTAALFTFIGLESLDWFCGCKDN